MLQHISKIAVAGVLTLLLAGPVVAHEKHARHGGSLDVRQHGYEHGYRDGLHHGREDRARGVSYDFKGEDYKHADRGYEHYMGSEGHFKDGYRDGYRAGYDDGYNGRTARLIEVYPVEPVPPGSAIVDEDEIYAQRGWGYTDVAYDIGYRYGVQAGRDDLRDGRPYDLARHDEYRDADHGYRDSYGSKEEYRRQFRSGFTRGYGDAFGR